MRGSFADIATAILIVVSMLVVLGVGWLVLSRVQAGFEQVAPEAAEAMEYGKSSLTAMGTATTFVVIAFGVAAIILAYFVRTHPIFAPLFFIIGSILIIVGAMMSNFAEQFASQVAQEDAMFLDAFGTLVWLATRQPVWVAVMIFAVLVLTYVGKQAVEGVM